MLQCEVRWGGFLPGRIEAMVAGFPDSIPNETMKLEAIGWEPSLSGGFVDHSHFFLMSVVESCPSDLS